MSVIAGPGVFTCLIFLKKIFIRSETLGAQGLCSFIGYPGVYIGQFHLHMYNAPAFASLIIFLILLILNWTLLLEEYPGIEKMNQSSTYVQYPMELIG